MSAGEILDTGFRLLRNHFVPLVGIAAIVNVPLAVVQTFVAAEAPKSPEALSPARLGILVVALLGMAVLSPIVQTAITVMLGDVYLDRATSIGSAFRRALSILFPLIGTSLLAGLIAIP